VLVEEPPEILRALKSGNVPVEIESVDAVDVEEDVVSQ
jgi:hypothetical protein